MRSFGNNSTNCTEQPIRADHPIDFILTFVDGHDPVWQKKREKYLETDRMFLERNYRSWDNLHYWFRCIAKFAPWVRKIFLITDHQIPEWLNTKNEKIVTIFHEDYIPSQYLPVFSANPIELNFHHIKGLSEHFVYFNDDTFIVSPTDPETFFQNGLPCDYPTEMPNGISDPVFAHIMANNIMTINKKYNRRETLRKYRKKFYSRVSLDGLKSNLFFSLFRTERFFGFINSHLPSAMLKSAYEGAWAEFRDDLDRTCRNRFRSDTDLNQNFIHYWMYVHGLFHPYNLKSIGHSFQLNDTESANNNIEKACSAILSRSLKLICLNDALIDNFETTKTLINTAMETIVPEKCEFEKGYFRNGPAEGQHDEY